MDRAALDAAVALGIAHGGWCPQGRLAEDGPIPRRYELSETDSPEYPLRTERNVLDSDATLILCVGSPSGGTELTRRLAATHGKPHLIVNLDGPPNADEVSCWLTRHRPATLNVAGSRESQSPGIARLATEFLCRLFGQM